MKSSIEISDRRAADAFVSQRQREIVQTLIGEELTLGALSRMTGLRLALLHYHVAKLIGLGLVEVVREQPRAGSALKFYRATAKAFFVPAELLDEAPGSGLTRRLRDRLDDNLARSLEGISFTHDGINHRAHLVKDATLQSTAVELWLEVGLSSADAAELAGELQALVDRFRARGKETEARHLVHLAAVRL